MTTARSRLLLVFASLALGWAVMSAAVYVGQAYADDVPVHATKLDRQIADNAVRIEHNRMLIAQAETSVSDAGTSDAGTSPIVDGGTGVVAAPAADPPPTALPNPVDNPGAAIDSLKAAKKLGWAAAILAAIVMLAAGLARAAAKWPTLPGLSWFAKHKTAIFVTAAVSTIGAAAYNAIALGGTWLAAGAAAVAALLTLIAPTPPVSQPSPEAGG